MAWLVSKDLGAYLDAAGDLLRSDPVGNTVALSVTETLRKAGPAVYGEPGLFGWWRAAGGAVTGAFFVTPPSPLHLVTVPDGSAESLVVTLRRLGSPFTRLGGEATAVDRFTRAWTRATGVSVRVHRRERLYRLGELVSPEPAPAGTARVAGPPDRGLLRSWHENFARDIGENHHALRGVVDDRLAARGYLLWEVAGLPVSMASQTRPVEGMVRISAVYTPDSHRRCGYAAAVTWATTARALETGASEVLLFADRANPVANRIYQRLGYVEVGDRVVVEFLGQ